MRIFEKEMKNRLNITISDHLLQQTKRYALLHNTSVSQLVEDYFIRLTRADKKKNVLDVIKQLPKPKISKTVDLKEEYYEDQKKKYGF
jgi:hypothetical protein